MKEALLILVLSLTSVGCAHLIMFSAIAYVNYSTNDRTQIHDFVTFQDYPLTARD